GPDGAGVYRLADANRDGKLEVAATLVKFRSALDEDPSAALGEHGPHGLTLGPDGHLYIVVGNHAQVESPIEFNSPYRTYYEGDIVPRLEDPGGHAVGVKAPGGVVLRLSVDGKKIERIAGGLRNAYDLAFDQWGNLLVHDSDMEADEGAPWYRPTRISHVVPGGEYGWRSGWAKWPDYWHDMLPSVVETGRGSPTGMVVYDHFKLPEKYHHNLIVCDWSTGQIVAMDLKAQGASIAAKSEVLLEGEPLAMTDLAVGPDGWIYFITGGRQTVGAVYRLTYSGESPDTATRIGTGVAAAIRYPQFHSAATRQEIAKIKQAEGERWDAVLPAIARTKKNSARFRTRALDLMNLYGPPPTKGLLLELAAADVPEVRVKAIDLMGLATAEDFGPTLAKLLADPDAHVRRHACEAMVRCGATATLAQLKPLLISDDRFEAFAARRLLERMPTTAWADEVLAADDHRLFIQGATALLVAKDDKATCLAVLGRFQELLPTYIADDDFVDMLRVCQVAVERGKIEPGDAPALAQALGDEFPASSDRMNRELLRLLVRLKPDGLHQRYVAYLRSNLDDQQRLHTALHLAMVDGWNSEQRMALVATLEELRS
ncbi:MAG: HEAT repeat domain-containing protein, partial [Planctomycetales bacterium]|nr:HEAT repeat domain-containing protein [Planctomycetales bacterium]